MDGPVGGVAKEQPPVVYSRRFGLIDECYEILGPLKHPRELVPWQLGRLHRHKLLAGIASVARGDRFGKQSGRHLIDVFDLPLKL